MKKFTLTPERLKAIIKYSRTPEGCFGHSCRVCPLHNDYVGCLLKPKITTYKSCRDIIRKLINREW